jgi:putative peptidoglycan lipid II flippase
MIRRRIAGAAAIIALGTLTTSLLGFVRAFVVARYFGTTSSTDAFFAALVVPQMFYDQLIGGAITAAFIPTFSRLADQNQRELWRLVGSVLGAVILVLLIAVAVLELAAPLVMRAIASGFALGKHGGPLSLSVELLRVLLPALVFMGLSAVAAAVLYSLNRRAVPAFATACYHIGIIVAAVIASARLGIIALPIGAVVGAAGQFAVQLPALLRAQSRVSGNLLLTIRLELENPVLRRMVRLYLPVAAGMCVSIAGQVADVNFKSHLPQHGGLSAMQYATQLVQFPIGIVVAGLGFAVLPSISADAAAERLAEFKETLTLGFRLVLLLLVPSAVGLMILATPIVTLLFQYGHFHHSSTVHTATALLGYGPQLPVVGVDQLLIFAFYARHNTLTPALAGVVGVIIYVVAAALLLGPLTIFGLALANTIQIGCHALLLLVLLFRSLGSLPWHRLVGTGAKVSAASAAMALVILAVQRWLTPSNAGAYTHLVAVGLPILAAVAVYAGLIVALRVEEASVAWRVVRLRLVGGR